MDVSGQFYASAVCPLLPVELEAEIQAGVPVRHSSLLVFHSQNVSLQHNDTIGVEVLFYSLYKLV